VAPLRVAVIGTGAFGRNHLRVYRELEQSHPDLVTLTGFVELDAERREALAAQFQVPAFATLDALLDAQDPATDPGAPHLASEMWFGKIDAASVCVPTIHHAAIAEKLLLAGIDILIEKPFAATLSEGNQILALAQQHNRIVAVGHLERFNPAVTATLAALNKPMFFEAHRLSIFTPRSLDVDVVLDLMIHDLDIVLALAQSPVKEIRAVGIPILSRKTDIANVRLEFASGAIANFTASRVSTEQVRKLRLFQPHQYLSLDFARQELLTISVDPSILGVMNNLPPALPAINLSSRLESASFADAAERPAASLPAPQMPMVPNPGAHPTAGMTLVKSDIPKAEPLRLELEDFLIAIRDRTQPRVPAAAGLAALSLALEINAAIASHARNTGLL
jgi:predicted dehydrogenase